MKIDKIFINKNVQSCKETEILISKIKIDPEIVPDFKKVIDYVNLSKDPVLKGKKTLYITYNHGALIKECPGTSYYTCCDYTILYQASFCPMDCSYCILQAYFHPPVLQYFVEQEKSLLGQKTISKQLNNIFKQNKIYRIGTGEFTDSLIWEKLNNKPFFSVKNIVKKFAKQNNSILELKTKTVNIESLENIDHNNKTIISWSLNTQKIIKSEERFTASLIQRLKAAKQCESWGYKLGFHFDPVVIYENSEKEYQKVIKLIFQYVKKENIVWISIGSFRFMPDLKSIIKKRFPQSKIIYGEFIKGLDNKMRYFKPLRIELYKEIVLCIKKYAPNIMIYFCMEDQEVWEKSLGFFPSKKGELGAMLDNSAANHCGLFL